MPNTTAAARNTARRDRALCALACLPADQALATVAAALRAIEERPDGDAESATAAAEAAGGIEEWLVA